MKKRNKRPVPVRLAFVLYIIMISAVITAAFSLFSYFMGKTAAGQLPTALWLLISVIVLCVAISTLVGIRIIGPMTKLGKAMGKVARGDYKVKLDTEKGLAEIRRMNESFNIMTRELEATEILQTDFVSNVSHEFKTPINAIEGYATLLQGADEDDRQIYTDKILYNTRRLSSLVGNILLLSKVDNRSIPAAKTKYRLDEQIRRCIVYLEPRWMAKNVKFDADMEQIEYTGQEELLAHVWNNLIENAIKFGPDHGRIRIGLYKSGENVVFTIRDEGPGIKDEDKKHIFDRFYQADSSHRGEGNGLGLALVRRITDIEGGTVTADNAKEGGCIFTVTLKN